MLRFVMEAIVVGIVFGILSVSLQIQNDAYRGFVAGVIGHVIFEVLQVNYYYCKHGYACRKGLKK